MAKDSSHGPKESESRFSRARSALALLKLVRLARMLVRGGYNMWLSAQHWEWRAIALCILTATVYWFFHSLNGEYTANLRLPIRFEYQTSTGQVEVIDAFSERDDDFYQEGAIRALKVPPSYIEINATASGWNLLRKSLGIGVKPISISLENPSVYKSVAGNNFLQQIINQNKELREVNFILTDSIEFDFDTIATRVVYVETAPGSIDLPPDYERVSPIEVTPRFVTLIGPSSKLARHPDTLRIDVGKAIGKAYGNVDDNLLVPIRFAGGNDPVRVKGSPRVNVKCQIVNLIRQRIPAEVEVVARALQDPDSSLYLDEVRASVSYKVRADMADSVLRALRDADYDTAVVTVNSVNLNLQDSTALLTVKELWRFPKLCKDIRAEPQKARLLSKKPEEPLVP